MANVIQKPEELVGLKLGKCRLDKLLGTGGMGSVFLATDQARDTQVAVKVLSPQLAHDDEYVQRFIREGKEALKIKHANVVEVSDTGQQDGTYYIVMEYVRGRALDEVLREEKRLTFTKATRIVRDVAKALEAAQGRNVMHRDIKPANILIDHKGVPKLCDFGLAKQRGSRGLTLEGLFMGTPEYVSPEQAEGKQVDFRTDIYALGVTYYQLLSGKFPFTGQTDVEIAMKRLKEDPRPLQDAFPGVDPRAIPVVDKMLKREAGQRYQNAADLLKDLNPLVREEKKSRPPTVKTATIIKKLPIDVQRRVRTTFASVMLAPSLLAFMAAGGAVTRGQTDLDTLKALLSAPWTLSLFGAGAAALLAGIVILRRELRSSGRFTTIALMMVLAALCATVATALVERPRDVAEPLTNLFQASRELVIFGAVQPVNFMILAVALAAVMGALCLEMDEDSPRPTAQQVGLVLSGVFWYGFCCYGQYGAPWKLARSCLEVAIPLVVLTLFAGFFGVGFLSMRTAEVSTRKIGLGLLGLAAAGILIFGAGGSEATLGSPGSWPGTMWARLKTVPAEFMHSGALAIVAIALVVASVLVLRAGLAQMTTFYAPKK